MDPNLFHIDWERTLEAVVGIIVLSFLVERTCALLFESRWWISRFEDARVGEPPGSGKNSQSSKSQKALAGRRYPIKEFFALVIAFAVCKSWDFDAVSIIMLSEHTKLVGIIITAAVIAGGSKASISLFHDLLKVQSSAAKKLGELKKED